MKYIPNISLDRLICPKCNTVRNDAGNCIIAKCDSCGYQECPLCGDELNNGFCISCHGHMILENYHSIGGCPECVELKRTLEELNDEVCKL